MQELPHLQYTLWLEPDVRIVRPGWLNRVTELVIGYQRVLDHEGLWMLGSLPQGSGGKSGHWQSMAVKFSQRFHLNGNAIYNTGSEAFRRFLVLVRENDVPVGHWQSGPHGNAFDVDIATYLWQVRLE